MDPKTLRELRKNRILARTAANRNSQKTESAYNYNPLFQKMTTLGPNGHNSSGYHYFGPPPDAGTSYGCYHDAQGNQFIAPLPAAVQATVPDMPAADEEKSQTEAGDDELIDLPKSPATGEEMELDGPVSAEETEELMKAELPTKVECSACKISYASSINLSKPYGKIHCANCGTVIKAEDAAPVAPPVSEEQDKATSEDKPEETPEADKTEAVQYEVLQSYDSFKDLTEADVNMTLFDDNSKNPYWNIDFRGTPVARVYLEDQPKPEEIRSLFISEQYANGVTSAVAKVGAREVLRSVKARFWANAVDNSAIAQRITAQVEASVKKDFDGKLKVMADRFLANVGLVCAGMDKNFYQDLGNPLKEAFYAHISKAGVYNPIPVIEASFRDGSTQFFETVFKKANEYMSMEPKALAEIKKAIADSDVITEPVSEDEATGEDDAAPEDDAGSGDDAPTLHARLAAANVGLTALANLSEDQANTVKSDLRSRLSLSTRFRKV